MENIFCDHNVDPSKKDGNWILKACQKIWKQAENNQPVIFYKAREAYDRIDTYIQGKQSITKYKPAQGVDPGANASNLSIDWTPRSVIAKLVDIGEAKVNGRGYNISATPIDAVAKSTADAYYARIRTKILIRETARINGLNPDEFPAMQQSPDEPKDLEELQMSMQYNNNFNLAMETEMGIELIMYQNKFEQVRKEFNSNVFRYGVGVVKEDVDPNGDIDVRSCHPGEMVVSSCNKADFSDKNYVGHLRSVPMSELAKYFNDEQLEIICETARRNNGEPAKKYVGSKYNREDDFNVKVLDVEFKSWNKKSWRQNYTRFGNLVVTPEKMYVTPDKDKNFLHDGKELPRYITQTREVIYKAKWIVDTNFIYDYGIAKNEKRSKPNRALTDFSYHIYATNYAGGEAMSHADRLIPIVDEYQNTVYKIQNFKQRWIPYIVDIDFDAIENIQLGKGGKKLNTKEVLDLVFQKYVLPNRRRDISGQNINYKAVDIRQTGMGQEFSILVQDLARLLNEMRDVIGLNEITDGSSPNPNLLNGVAALGAEATNNALKPLMDADKFLVESVAQGIVRRLVQVVKSKKVEGMLPALGENSMRFFELTPEISLYDWGIKLEIQPDQLQREAFIQKLKMADANGQINPADFATLMYCRNLKQGAMLLAYRMEKKLKEEKMYAMQQIQANSMAQQESNRVTAEQQRQTKELEHQHKMAEIELTKNWEYKIKKLQVDSQESMKEQDSTMKMTSDIMAMQQADQSMQMQGVQ